MKLHPVRRDSKRSNRYCGPSALSALTGLDTEETARTLRMVSGKRSIKGTHKHWMLYALHHYGFRFSNFYTDVEKPTLAAWLKYRDPGKTYLVIAGNHWQVIQGRRYVCGLTRVIISLTDKRVKRRARVAGAWTVERDSINPEENP